MELKFEKKYEIKTTKTNDKSNNNSYVEAILLKNISYNINFN